MTNQEMFNLCIFIAICIAIYIFFNVFNIFNVKEGLIVRPRNADIYSYIQPSNNVAGNAAMFATDLQDASIKLTDVFLISKYRSDYEHVILNLDSLIDSLMLNTVLSVDVNNPSDAITKLATLNNAKDGLNNVMKFVDASK